MDETFKNVNPKRVFKVLSKEAFINYVDKILKNFDPSSFIDKFTT